MYQASIDVYKIDRLIQYLKSVPSSEYDFCSTSANPGEPKCVLAHAYTAGIADGQSRGSNFANMHQASRSLGFDNYLHFLNEMQKSLRLTPFSFMWFRGWYGKYSAIVALKGLKKRAEKNQLHFKVMKATF